MITRPLNDITERISLCIYTYIKVVLSKTISQSIYNSVIHSNNTRTHTHTSAQSKTQRYFLLSSDSEYQTVYSKLLCLFDI